MPLACLERLSVDLRSAGPDGAEQQRLAAGQQLRPLMRVFVRGQRRDGCRLAAGGRHAHDSRPDHRREQDCVVGFPGRRSGSDERIANDHGFSDARQHLLQFAAGEETQPLTVGREERVVPALRYPERPGSRTDRTRECRSVDGCLVPRRTRAAGRPVTMPPHRHQS